MVGVDDPESICPLLLEPRRPDSALHVVAGMLQRGISWTDVFAVVGTPTKTTVGHSGRMNYFGYTKGRRLIRVTLDPGGADVTVANAQTRATINVELSSTGAAYVRYGTNASAENIYVGGDDSSDVIGDLDDRGAVIRIEIVGVSSADDVARACTFAVERAVCFLARLGRDAAS